VHGTRRQLSQFISGLASIGPALAHQNQKPQINGICERFQKTALNEFYRVAFRKKVYRSIDEMQADLDSWVREYNRKYAAEPAPAKE
jgi:transposase InsO family protein